jgi:hypothetical protein
MLHEMSLVFGRRVNGTIEVLAPLQRPSASARETRGRGRRDALRPVRTGVGLGAREALERTVDVTTGRLPVSAPEHGRAPAGSGRR